MKFERNPCIRFRDNCDTDGRRTNSDLMSSADTVKQSEKSKKNFFLKFKKCPGIWPRGSNYNQNLKEIRALGSEILCHGRMDDGRRTMDDRRRTTDELRFDELC